MECKNKKSDNGNVEHEKKKYIIIMEMFLWWRVCK